MFHGLEDKLDCLKCQLKHIESSSSDEDSGGCKNNGGGNGGGGGGKGDGGSECSNSINLNLCIDIPDSKPGEGPDGPDGPARGPCTEYFVPTFDPDTCICLVSTEVLTCPSGAVSSPTSPTLEWSAWIATPGNGDGTACPVGKPGDGGNLKG